MSTTLRSIAIAASLACAALASPAAHAGGSVGIAIGAPVYGAPAYGPVGYPAYGGAPAPLAEAVPALAPGYYWRPGQWVWSNRHGGWEWRAGYAAVDPNWSAPAYYGPAPGYYSQYDYAPELAIGLGLGALWAVDGFGHEHYYHGHYDNHGGSGHYDHGGAPPSHGPAPQGHSDQGHSHH